MEEIVHSVEDKTCPDCGAEMETVGKEFVRDEIVYVPAKVVLRKHYVEKYLTELFTGQGCRMPWNDAE